MRTLYVLLPCLALVVAFFWTETPTFPKSENQTATLVNAIATSTKSEQPDLSNVLVYKVLKVVDGDTIAIDMNGKSVTLRLIGIDTPETLDPRKPVQCFGKEASNKAKELLEETYVSIEKDATQGEIDKYGRVLAYVFLEDGTFFNKYMIESGYAHEYTYANPYKHQAQFKAAEKEAREHERGLWSDNACAEESTREPANQSSAVTPATGGAYECSRNIYNCSSFKTQSEAQSVFDFCGLPGQGGSGNDVHKLDNDKDGVVCESLP